MKTFPFALLALFLGFAAHAQQADPGSGSYSRSAQHKSKNSAQSKIGGTPTNPPQRGTSSEGRPRAGFDVGMASATAGGRTDTGPLGNISASYRKPEPADPDRPPARQPPTLANPTAQEIAAAQARGRIRDQEKPPPDFTEQDWPNLPGTEQALENPYQHRQKSAHP
jgi:hypothetical protein